MLFSLVGVQALHPPWSSSALKDCSMRTGSNFQRRMGVHSQVFGGRGSTDRYEGCGTVPAVQKNSSRFDHCVPPRYHSNCRGLLPGTDQHFVAKERAMPTGFVRPITYMSMLNTVPTVGLTSAAFLLSMTSRGLICGWLRIEDEAMSDAYRVNSNNYGVRNILDR